MTVVTAFDAEGRPTGLTASSFASVSLDPPLVLICVAHKAQSYPAIQAGGKFAVNVLGRDQEAVSRRFASSTLSGPEKFEGIDYRQGALGLPLLKDALAELECRVVHAYPGGDHTIFVARVEAGDSRADAGLEPLVYYRGQYSHFHPPGGIR